MAKVTYIGSDRKWFQENMGRGCAMPIKPCLAPQTQERPISQEIIDQIFQEAREQWSGFDSACVEAFKRGDRIGLQFEGGTMFLPINEQRLQMALLSSQGSDESSMMDCFMNFVAAYDYTGLDQFVWDWLDYHERHHGTGYGKTYRDHFNLVAHIRKNQDQYPDHVSKLNKMREIAKDANSFGNGSLALVYPAYYYGCTVGEAPKDFVRYITSFTHANEDALRAVTLLCGFIENPSLIAEYHVPEEDKFKRLYCIPTNLTAYNTLMSAVRCAVKDSEMDAIREGIYLAGDSDSIMATALLLWTLKTNAA